MNTKRDLRPLLTENEAAEFLATTASVLRNCRSLGKGAYASLPHYKVGRSIKYRLHDLDRWLEKRQRGDAA